MALSAGGVLVGEQIARRLHTKLSLLLISRIALPGTESLVIGTMDHTGLFTYNSMIAAGETEEIMEDMRGWLEEAKMHARYELILLGDHGLTDTQELADKNVIIVTDGVKTGMSFDAAKHLLKRIEIKKAIAAIPIGVPEAIERVRQQVDEVHCLSQEINEALPIDHYYTDEPAVENRDVIDRIDNVASRWI